MILIFLSTICFSNFFIHVIYHPYILHCRMFALTIYHWYFAKIFVNFMWCSVKNKKLFNNNILFNTYTISWKHTIYLVRPYHTCLYTSMVHCLLPVLCLFWYTFIKNIWTATQMIRLFSKEGVNNYGQGGGGGGVMYLK